MGKQHKKISKNILTQKYMPEEWQPVVTYSHRKLHKHHVHVDAKETRPDGAEGV